MAVVQVDGVRLPKKNGEVTFSYLSIVGKSGFKWDVRTINKDLRDSHCSNISAESAVILSKLTLTCLQGHTEVSWRQRCAWTRFWIFWTRTRLRPAESGFRFSKEEPDPDRIWIL